MNEVRIKSRRLVALACLVWAPSAFAGEPVVVDAVPVMPVEVRDLPSTDAPFGGVVPNLSLPAVTVKAMLSKTRKATAAARKLSAVSGGGPVVLGDGPVALDLTGPGPQNLSSGATLRLNLPAGAVKAIAEASVGKDEDETAFWHKDRAQVTADLAGPLGTALNVTGENRLALTYRAPQSVGAADGADHVVRTESRSAHASLLLPLDPLQITVGSELTNDRTQEGSTLNLAQSAVSTVDHATTVKGEWQPLDGVSIEGGAAARVANISWQNAHSSTFRSVNPHLKVEVAPWRDTAVTATVEHTVAPYDAAAFANYSKADQAADVSGFQPDHSWQVETRIEQRVGAARLSATYTASRRGTVTEFAEIGGVQAPVSTPLLGRDSVAVAVSVPLAAVGLPRTELTSEARWQTSRVVDPVTLKSRTASGETGHQVSWRVSHKLPAHHLSVGLSGEYSGARSAYQVNELSTTAAGGSVGAFVAYKPGDVEIDFNVSGLYGARTRADFYSGARGASRAERTTLQDNAGPTLKLSLKRPF